MIPTHAPSLKVSRSHLAERYAHELCAHLCSSETGNGDCAQGLGRAALASGLDTRDLAEMHAAALLEVATSRDFIKSGRQSIGRARFFFGEALIPLETAERSTRDAIRRLQQRNETLRDHATALRRINRQLANEVSKRKVSEEAACEGRKQYQKLFLESQQTQKKLRQVTRQILIAQEAERKQISRELHDEVVQTLVGINVQLTAMHKATPSGLRPLRSKIVATQRLVENSVLAVHRFARGLRPAVLDDLGLIPALHAYCKTLSAQKKFQVKLTAFAAVEELNADGRTVLYRVAQEALNNVARHAHATSVTVNIERAGSMVGMEIHDDGKSFAVEKKLLAKNNKRLGLIGMKERVEMVGGALTIESAPGAGTKVRAEIPFDRGEASQ
jgi:two-component system sensor histidine kinase DegS